jgi:signal transduction histidine kinase
VVDDGLGIPPEDQPRIFEKFSQAGSAARLGGSGLGLTFCRMAVEAHGGAIGVESASNCGSTFWFSLPSALAPSPAKCSSPIATGH